MMIDFPSYDYDNKDKEENIELTSENANDILNYINTQM